MKYADGQDVRLGDRVRRLGDRVRLGRDEGGVVVALIDTDEYSGDLSDAQGGYLEKGVMIKFPLYGLMHYEDAEPDPQLIERADARGLRLSRILSRFLRKRGWVRGR
jgi:hypothetical protein